MPCFTSQSINGQILFVCNVVKPLAEGEAFPDLGTLKGYTALLDTGAQATCIRKNIVDDLGLQPSGWSQMVGVGGVVDCEKYMVDLTIAITETQPVLDKSGKITNQQLSTIGKGFPNINASLLSGDNFNFDVLIGMDVIQQCHLTIHTGNQFTLCI